VRRNLIPERRRPPEATIALINIIFLMLIFFLVVGTISSQAANDVTLASIDDIDTQPPSDALIMRASGILSFRGRELSVSEAVSLFEETDKVRLLPDRAAPASEVIALAKALRASGVNALVLVTEKGL
jgi:biopolymer transport protein ExbD